MKKIVMLIGLLLIALTLASCGFSEKEGYTKILSTEPCGVGSWTYSEQDLIKEDIENRTSLYSSAYTVSTSYAESTVYLFKYDNYYSEILGVNGVVKTYDYYRNYTLTKNNNKYYVQMTSYIIYSFEYNSTTTTSKTMVSETTNEYSNIQEALNSITMDNDTTK